MASEDEQAQRVKFISDQLQLTFEALRRAGANIGALLQQGRATCEEVRAYNAWAVAIFETQRGMLSTLRAAGKTDLPAQPPPPTLFPIRGRTGLEAIQIDCGDGKALAGFMAAAMKPSTKYLSTNEVEISTSDPFVYQPQNAPSFKQLVILQAQREQEKTMKGLGLAPIVILIAVVVVTLTIGTIVAALMHYLEVNEIEEQNTERVRLQAEAFAQYVEARQACLAQCTSRGGSHDDCVDECAKLVDKPEFDLPGAKKWGVLEWTGFTVLLAGGLWASWRIVQRNRQGRPIFELPESPF